MLLQCYIFLIKLTYGFKLEMVFSSWCHLHATKMDGPTIYAPKYLNYMIMKIYL